MCRYVKSKLITCKRASTSDNASEQGKDAAFPLRHILAPLYYCNAADVVLDVLLCGLWWDVHLLITGVALFPPNVVFPLPIKKQDGCVLLDVSSSSGPGFNVVWAHVALLS